MNKAPENVTDVLLVSFCYIHFIKKNRISEHVGKEKSSLHFKVLSQRRQNKNM